MLTKQYFVWYVYAVSIIMFGFMSFGLLGPWLISRQSDAAVITGIAVYLMAIPVFVGAAAHLSLSVFNALS